jgi:hypothetical protein
MKYTAQMASGGTIYGPNFMIGLGIYVSQQVILQQSERL